MADEMPGSFAACWAEIHALRARVAELEQLLMEAHGHVSDYCDDCEQDGFRTIAAMAAELLARIEAALPRLSDNKSGERNG